MACGGMARCVRIVLAVVVVALGASATADERVGDERLAKARRFVESSGRYLHHSTLTRGTNGYGLSVFAGTNIERFDVEILSVMTDWGPQQDVILARLGGAGLDKSGVIAGMSGSPVFVRRDGRDRMIGAVAYAWTAQKEAICGIQPITQMLAVAGALPDNEAPADEATTGPASRPATRSATRPVASMAHIRELLRPAKRDFSGLGLPEARREGEARSTGPRLRPVVTPLTASGLTPRAMEGLTERLAPVNMVPVQGGGVGAAEVDQAGGVAIEPGASMSVTLVTGDVELAAAGTVTDVVDGRVLGFGHAFFGMGEADFTMGPGYVHAVIPSITRSFKLSAMLRPTGALRRDEQMGVLGLLDAKATTIPMEMELRRADGRTQRYRYALCRHQYFTPMLTAMLIYNSAWAWYELPPEHTVAYEASVDFGELGVFEVRNVGAGSDLGYLASDTNRVISAMLNTPFGEPPPVRSVRVSAVVEEGRREARIVDFRLDGEVYRPGETVTGKVIVQPYRRERESVDVSFELPDDIAEGEHVLTAVDWDYAATQLEWERPHEFDPRTTGQLLASIRRMLDFRTDEIYLRLPLGRGGVALGARELPDLPASRVGVLADASLPDAWRYEEARVRTVRTDWELVGAAEARFKVQRHPRQLRLRSEKGNQ